LNDIGVCIQHVDVQGAAEIVVLGAECQTWMLVMDGDEVKTIQDWDLPPKVEKLRSFLG